MTAAAPQPADERAYFCKVCGYSPANRASWCDLGCGRDYNEMIGVPQRHLDGLLADLAQATKDRDGEQAVKRHWRKSYVEVEARVAALETALREQWFANLSSLDYEVDDPDRPNQTIWAWRQHPCFTLLGLTDDECRAALAASAPAEEQTRLLVGEHPRADGATEALHD